MSECSIFIIGLEETEFTLMLSVDDSKVLHGSLGHHLEAPIQTGEMQKQETYEIQQGQIHNPVHAIERCTQLYRLRLTLGRSSSAKDLGVPQTAVRIPDALPSPRRVWVPEGCIWGQLAEQNFSGRGAAGRHSRTSTLWLLGAALSRGSLSWSHTDLSRPVPVPVHGLLNLTWWTSQLRPDWFPSLP